MNDKQIHTWIYFHSETCYTNTTKFSMIYKIKILILHCMLKCTEKVSSLFAFHTKATKYVSGRAGGVCVSWVVCNDHNSPSNPVLLFSSQPIYKHFCSKITYSIRLKETFSRESLLHCKRGLIYSQDKSVCGKLPYINNHSVKCNNGFTNGRDE